MKKILLITVIAVVTMLFAPAISAAQGLRGKWNAKILGGESFLLVLRQDGSILSGTCDGRELSGSVDKDHRFEFKVAPYKDAQGRTISKHYFGNFEPDFITGSIVIHTASDRVEYHWRAERDK